MLAIITGSGGPPGGILAEPVAVPDVPWGAPSGQPQLGVIDGEPVLLLPRHGLPHHVAPHRINYRANIAVLAALGATRVIALNTVGGISASAWPGRLVVPDQLIDYTWGREATFVADDQPVVHVDFALPFDAGLRARLLAAGQAVGLDVGDGGTYGCTQGPRFETAAEINRMARDGCSLVGMTGMPEAVLAREQGLAYAMLSLVVNPAAGQAADPFNLDAIAAIASAGRADMGRLLSAFIRVSV